MQSGDMAIRFWGVRGSIARPGPATSRYGGNTSCVEVRCGEHVLIFDGGTGLFDLGRSLMRNEVPLDADLFFSHTHFDHINGVAFFAPLYVPGNRLRLWAGHLLPEYRLQDLIFGLMAEPLFPVPQALLKPQMEFIDFSCGETLSPSPGIILKTLPLNHPNRASGYRIEYNGKVVAYITDTEHTPGNLDDNVLSLIENADIMIYDSTYTEQEYPNHVGWGHSTWLEGVRLANAARVQTYVLFHHDPDHDDVFMDRIATEVQAARPGTLVASEGLELRL
jgi:phosphoribosyl 1,2-cyclic phosphodiesterase